MRYFAPLMSEMGLIHVDSGGKADVAALLIRANKSDITAIEKRGSQSRAGRAQSHAPLD
jgi:hypothetical protein